MNLFKWLVAGIAGAAFLVTGIAAFDVEIVQEEERSRGRMEIFSEDFAVAEEGDIPQDGGIHIAGVEIAAYDRHLYSAGITARGAD